MVDQVRLGNSGLKVSAVGLGCNNFGWSIGPEESRPVVQKALDLGITFFDTADVYGDPPGRAEEVLGPLIRGHREKIVLASKFGLFPNGGPPVTSRSYVLSAIEDSLKRLGTDYLDLYMIHMPDPDTPMDETLRALDDIVTSGKARYIGASNMEAWRMADAHWTARELGTHRLLACQNEYSLLNRTPEAELIPALSHYGMSIIPYFPLASGMLTGKYLGEAQGRLGDNFLGLGDKFLTKENLAIVRQLAQFAEQRGRSLLELAISWLACQPAVAGVIAGATKAEQVEQNASAASWKLTPEELLEVDRITLPGAQG